MKIHIVQKGDTLWEIAKKYGVDFEELKQLNSHLASPDMIMPGMKIRIPTHSKKVTYGDKKQVKTQPKAKQAPAPKTEMKQPDKKSIQLPPMPSFPLEQPKTLPKLEMKPTPTPEKSKKKIVQPKTEKKETPVAPIQEQPQPLPMPPIEYPCHPMPQMMPMYHPCPCPCHMPMYKPPCGCGGGFPYHGHPYHYAGHPGMYQQGPLFMQPGEMMQPPYVDPQAFVTGMQQAPDMYQGADANAALKTPEMPNMETQTYYEQSFPYSGPYLQMYPEPPAGMRNSDNKFPSSQKSDERENPDDME